MVDYNRLVRPVKNNNETVNVSFGLKLTQLIDLNLKSHVLSTNVWLEHQWYDHRLKWEPLENGKINRLYLPVDQIWLPHIVLLNSADGNYLPKLTNKVIVNSNGLVEWQPPAIFKSRCNIDIRWFPFDSQSCILKFGLYTNDAINIRLNFINQSIVKNNLIQNGIDLTEFNINSEWDLMSVPAQIIHKHSIAYSNSAQEILFKINLRRKKLYYFVHLVLPCIMISILSIFVFYLPSNSKEKMTLSVSILVCLSIFLYIVSEIVSTNSLSTPLIGRYLFFTLFQVTLSILLSTLIVNIYYKSETNLKANCRLRKFLLRFLPNLLKMQPLNSILCSAQFYATSSNSRLSTSGFYYSSACQNIVASYHSKNLQSEIELNSSLVKSEEKNENTSLTQKNHVLENFNTTSSTSSSNDSSNEFMKNFSCINNMEHLKENFLTSNSCLKENQKNLKKKPIQFEKAVKNLNFLANHIHNAEQYSKVQEEWRFLAIVLDRLFLWIFGLSCLIGWLFILLQAPSLYDNQQPIDRQETEIYL
uniref:Nicotinic acetylcholine receptor n=1 Tax=Polyphagotarsonemus latus TaxID=1204166 RepID=A0AAN0LP86_9ACAR